MYKFNKLNKLKDLFEKHIPLSVISEELIAFDAQKDVKECFAFMQKKHFDIIGVEEKGIIVGYAGKKHRCGLCRNGT